nr:serine hydrolase [candidate division Zixibacteria bacterium]NIT59222.1 serine hydrolase [Fodinibius sp.]NIW40483.1 serine hydrolase [candidate division Zixibacteria bacterium]NIX57806.1 serine hydrolase [candidate division Zixibacteria bacterium]NIY27805.1 serine hydrolase [Fodinibius sp.]
MRLIEIFLVSAVLVSLLTNLTGWKKSRLLARLIVYISIVLLFIHWILEGLRWQLWPVYIVACAIFLVHLISGLRYKNQFRSRYKKKTIWKAILIIIGLLLSVASIILAYVLPVFDLPEPTGPYPIGTTELHFIDYNRHQDYTSINSGSRQIPVKVWYPASERNNECAPYLDPAETEALAVFNNLPPFLLSHFALVETHSGTDLAVADGAFPVVIYLPSGFVAQATALCEELASNGFIVIAVNHVHWNAYTTDSSGTVVVNDRSNKYYRQMWQEELSDRTGQLKDRITLAENSLTKLQLYNKLNESMPTEVQDIHEWSHDVSFIINQLQKEQGLIDLAKAIDFSRIAVIGFSKGGAAAGQVCIDDHRICAGINLDGFMFGDIVDSVIPCPFMFIHSEPFVAEAYINDAYYSKSPEKSILMKVSGAKHANFSDMSLWGELITAQENFGSINGHRVIEIMNTYVLAFLNSTLNGTVESLLTCPSGEYWEVEILKKVGSSDIKITPLSGEYLGQKPPGCEPKLLAQGIIPYDGIQHCFPTFTPDGKEVYWMSGKFIDDRFKGTIWYMKEKYGIWSSPKIAAFSGEYNDHAPFFTSDGNRLYFSSDRPGGFGKAKNIWYVDRTESGWSNPINLGSPPNTDLGATQASFTSDGTVYFIGQYEGTQWKTAIYRSKLINGKYQQPEVLDSPIRTAFADVYPFIAPDESYLIFGSTRPGGNSIETDLYFSCRNPDDTWETPIHLNEEINNGMSVSFPFISHDGKFLFFNRFDSTGTDKFYWVDARVIETMKSYTASLKIQKSGVDKNMTSRLNYLLDSCRSNLDIVGLSAAIVWSDGREWTGVSGNSTDEQPIRDDMLFGIGSATKTYIAALMLKYVENELLNLDDQVTKWLSDLPVELADITIRQLLNHTSGLFNYMEHSDYNTALFAFPDTIWTARSLLNSFMQAPYAKPGNVWHYSAANYLILGMIIEKLSGNVVHDAIRNELLQPLDLSDTYLYPQELYSTDRMAHLWMVLDTGGAPVDINLLVGKPPLRGMFSSVWTAGAINATALDAATWLTDLFAGRIITKASLDEMRHPTPLSGDINYGLGLITEDIEETKAVGHSGGIGYSSLVLHFVTDSLSVAVLGNCQFNPKPVVSALYREVKGVKFP